MVIRKFEDLQCWRDSRELMNEIYSLTEQGKFRRDFGLRDQIQRAAVSVMTNISEGFDSHSDKAFRYFLTISFCSAAEVQSLLYVAIDRHYISQEDFEKLYKKLHLIKNLIGGMTLYLNKENKNHNS